MTKEIIEEVKIIKEHLKDLAPNATDIKIEVKEHRQGLYQSTIKIKLPRKRPIFVFKKSFDPFSSLVKGHQAILKQIFKERSRRKRMKSPFLVA